MGSLPPVFIEFLGLDGGFKKTAAGVKTELAAVGAKGTTLAKLGAIAKPALLGIAGAAVVVGAKTTHMAADFETAMTRVRTGAGESADNMGLVSRGVLQMAGEVGKSTKELTASLYTVESAGYHGQQGLDVLRVAAMGAKVGAAELPPVADALTTAMNAFKGSNLSATDAMNGLIATEANGKTNLEALAGSMSSILPVAAAAKVGFNEIMGAMATMTAQGTTADVSATYLRQTIGQLSNPSAKAAQEMRGLGLNATQVAQDLGKKGLAATLTELTDAIQSKMGPAGTVIVDTLRKASSNTDEFQKALANLKPAEQTQIGALATMVGGTKSMMGALQLTGVHMKDFQSNTKKVTEQIAAGGGKIEGWADVQKTFNQRMAESKGKFEALGISIGQDLMPVASKFADWLGTAAGFLASNKLALEAFAVGMLAVTLGLTAASIASWSFTDSLLASPITWIVVGIVLVVAALALLISHWRQVWTWIKSISKDVLDWLVGAWHWLASETASVWHSISAGIASAWHAVAAFFASAWHAVANPIVAAWHWIANTTSAVFGAIAGFFRKWWPLLLLIFMTPIALLIGLWNHTHVWIANTAKSIWGGIASFFSSIWNWISGVALDAWNLIYQYVIMPTKALGSGLMQIWNAIAGWLGSAWNWVAGKAAAAWNLVYQYTIWPLGQLLAWIGRWISQLASWFASGFNSILGFLLNLGGRFISVGESIVSGIVRGLTGAWHWLTDKVRNLANDALGAAKSVLGINSPSRVFANVVGRAIPEGIAAGVEKHGTKALAAVRKLAGATTGGIGAFEPAFAGGPGAVSGGGQIVRHETHVHVTVQGSVTADRDLANTIQRVMLQKGARNSTTYTPFRR
jgi:TP901 family phage tail tape measure protein